MRLALLVLALLTILNVSAQQTDFPEDIILMKQVLNAVNDNDPLHALNQFSYDSYENLKITGDPEAITGPGYKKTELRKTLKQTRVFFAEKTSTYIYDEKYGFKEQIIGADMPGFEEPVYPIYNINFQSTSIYDKHYIIFDRKFVNPISNKGLKTYIYSIVKDSTINGRAVQKVRFDPINDRNPSTIQGHFYLDKQSLAIASAHFSKSGDLQVDARHDFKYNQDLNLWFNTSRQLFIKKEKDKKEFELFGARLQVGTEKTEKKKNTNEDLYVFLKAANNDFQNSLDTDYGRKGLVIEVLDKAINKPVNYWDDYRDKVDADNAQFESYQQIDSVVAATNVTKKLETLDKFKVGYYPIGFFDIDLKYLVKFNDYEAFRLGIGGTTNEKFSEKFRLGGYIAYGTKDKAIKYNVNAGYRLSREKNTWINVYHTDDIQEFAAESFLTDARVYSLFEPRLVNIPTFYLYREYGTSLQQRLLPSVLSEVSLSRKRIAQTTAYRFQPGDIQLSEYALSELKIGARWSPYSTYMRSPNGYQERTNGFPVLSAQLTKGFKDVIDSDFNYVKVSAKASYELLNEDKSRTQFMVEGHYASGEVPLTHLFHAYPNAPNKETILQRFSVAGRRSFETMYFNEFFSDRIAIFQGKHSFAPFKIASYLQPELVLISRFAIGNLDDQQQHINVEFDTLEHGYLESGFELNKLLFGFGLSTSYRYGAYHLPNFEDNISVKFTFYLEL
ncbi:hypothetical protein EJ995_03990 [Nonlabens ponticola]|uniref:Carboxypeptidase-like regulatory domain-containing protein n=1 Tax=Nonlabens ponticola TaxID=2496866 RepID=A0A3S9N1E1_9FLAO|nr:hypothetical protein EJ995_03990 [Nonlabens ponticola]